jgi:hypothetical protein
MDRHLPAPWLRLLVAIGLGALSVTGSILLIVTDAISGNTSWAHHPGVSAAPLLLIAGAITAASIAHPPHWRHALIRLVAAMAFAAWGTAQLVPGPTMAGVLNDLAILLFVVDAGYAVIPDARARLTRHRRRATAAWPAPSPADSGRPVSPATRQGRPVSPATRQPTPAGAAAPPCCAIPSTRCACTAEPPGT